MTKQELIDILESLPDDVVILLSSDEEGNRIREARVGELEKAYTEDTREWVSVHPDDIDGYDSEDLRDAVIFW